MAILVKGNGCGAKLKMPDEYSGMEATCPACKALLMLNGEHVTNHEAFISYSNKAVADATPRRSKRVKASLVVAGTIATLIVLLLPSVLTMDVCTEREKAVSVVTALACAMENFHGEYHRFPGQNATNNDHQYSAGEYRFLIAALRGSNFTWHGSAANPRCIPFVSLDAHSFSGKPRNGTAQIGELADPWDNRYEVVADWNGDARIATPPADGEKIERQTVAVWSYGPEGRTQPDPHEPSHIRSWR